MILSTFLSIAAPVTVVICAILFVVYYDNNTPA